MILLFLSLVTVRMSLAGLPYGTYPQKICHITHVHSWSATLRMAAVDLPHYACPQLVCHTAHVHMSAVGLPRCAFSQLVCHIAPVRSWSATLRMSVTGPKTLSGDNSLRNHVYSNILKILKQKKGKFSDKKKSNLIFFIFLLKT